MAPCFRPGLRSARSISPLRVLVLSSAIPEPSSVAPSLPQIGIIFLLSGRFHPPLERTIREAEIVQRSMNSHAREGGNRRGEEQTPLRFHLSQNYPEPFQERTSIKYCVAYECRVVLTVFDNDGKEVARLVDKKQPAGTYEVEFEAVEGDYLYRLEAGDFKFQKLMHARTEDQSLSARYP